MFLDLLMDSELFWDWVSELTLFYDLQVARFKDFFKPLPSDLNYKGSFFSVFELESINKVFFGSYFNTIFFYSILLSFSLSNCISV